MPSKIFDTNCKTLLQSIEDAKQTKILENITGHMGASVNLRGKGDVIMLCSNNYLGLANHPEVMQAGKDGIDKYGAGTASVRFICGTFDCHETIEQSIARFVGTESALSYVSCWCANEALFPTVVSPKDVVLSDELNHASLIDGMRLMSKKTAKEVYKNNDLEDLENKLKANMDKEVRWVVTDGVFSMEGSLVDLPGVSALCKKYDAMLVVDDSHGIGVLGKNGRGTPDHFNMMGEVDIITGTLGKALGGAAGGYVAAGKHVTDLLTQRSRPALFSNALPASVACSANKAIEIVEREPERVAKLHNNRDKIRDGLIKLGYDCTDSPTAIIPIIIGDTADAIAKSKRMLELGVFVIGFGFPVVPKNEARLRVQVSAALEDHHIEKVLDAFAKL